MPVAVASATFKIWVDGTDVSTDIINDLETITVEDNLYLPDTFSLRLRMRMVAGGQGNSGGNRQDRAMRWLDDPIFKIGKSLKIKLAAAPDNTITGAAPPRPATSNDPRLDHLIDGEITALEVDLQEDSSVLFTVRGFDRSHKLQKGSQVRSFVNMSDSDIVKKIAQEAGLNVGKVDRTTETYPYLLQGNQTNWDFLQDRATRTGYELFVDGKDLYFRPRSNQPGSPIELKPGEKLLSFHARQNSAGENIEVLVRGWNPLKNQEVLGKAKASQANPTHISPNGSTPGGGSNVYQFTRPVTTQAEADMVAQGLLDYITGNFMQMEGSCYGDQRMRAGTWIELKGFGGQFNGKYYLTSTLHLFTNGRGGRNAGYTVEFKSEGGRTGTLLEAAGGDTAGPIAGKFGDNGPVPAIVTNIKDPEKLGRVKVRWPHIGPDVESNWARVVSPHHGMMLRPAVGQEVLVAFEDGDINKPYVIGALWNSKNHPPNQRGGDGEITGSDHFMIVTAKGNVIAATDKPIDGVGLEHHNGPVIQAFTDNDGTGIELNANGDSQDDCRLVMVTGDNIITVDAKGNIEITSKEGDITIKSAMGKLTLDAMSGIEISSQGQVKIKGAMIDLN